MTVVRIVLATRAMTGQKAVEWSATLNATFQFTRLSTQRSAREAALRHYVSTIATARVQPAEAPRILTGKQLRVKPSAGSASRLCSFSRWQ